MGKIPIENWNVKISCCCHRTEGNDVRKGSSHGNGKKRNEEKGLDFESAVLGY